jgi:hypothetical protein
MASHARHVRMFLSNTADEAQSLDRMVSRQQQALTAEVVDPWVRYAGVIPATVNRFSPLAPSA